ncbi:MAG: 2-methoxy-6-polyprenyl-1,4-benzoquinol methylase, mitochondrial [Desulfovibrio sp.]
MWDAAAAERYEAWYESPRGAFALAREQRLIADIISPWQRRNQTLLEIGCGAGHFLEMFYHGGFDVTGIDKSEAMLEKARNRMGCKATLRTGTASHLPFDDGEFDYVAMVTALECMGDPEEVLEEAFRVATRGVVIAFLNAWSLYGLEHKYKAARASLQERAAKKNAAKAGYPLPEPERKRMLQQARWFNILGVGRMVRKTSGKFPDTCRSTLFSPSFLWRGNKPFSLSWWHLLPFGAVSVVRVDLTPVSPTTMTIRTPKVARTVGASAGVVTMDRYPQSKEK